MKLVIPRSRVFALILGFAGVILILRPTEGSLSIASLIGLTGGLFAAIAQLGVRQLSKVESTETILSYYFIISTVVSFFPMVYAWKPIGEPMLWFLLLLIGLFSLIYQYLLTRSLTHAPATKVSTMNYLSVIFSGLLGWWFFNEVPSLWVVGGVFLIIGGGVIALLSREEARHWKKKP
jgi:drug/metabolite transporter (DMT)-like permease